MRRLVSEILLVFVLLVMIAPTAVHAQFVPKPGGISPALPVVLTNWFQPDSASCTVNLCTVDSIRADVGDHPNRLTSNGAVFYKVNPGLNFNGAIGTIGGSMHFSKNVVWLGTNFAVSLVFSAPPPISGATGDWKDDSTLIGTRDPSGGFDYFGIMLKNGNLTYSDDNGNATRFTSTGVYEDGFAHVVFINRGFLNGGTADSQVWIDGFNQGRFNSDFLTLDDFTEHRFGAGDNPTGTTCSATYGDFILYQDSLIAANRERVETYLALKYGITLGHDYKRVGGTTNTIIYHLDGRFDNEIIGIGRADSSDFRTKYSKPTKDPNGMALYHGIWGGSFPIANSSGPAPTNNTYQIMGHNGNAPAFTKSFGGGSNNKMSRIFKVTDVGAYGMVSVAFDTVKYNLGSTGTYYLAYSADSGIGIGEVYIPMQDDGNGRLYAEVNFPDNDTSYFTIVRQNTFTGPADVVTGIELWLRSDTGMVGTVPNNITAWNDLSGNNHNVNTSTPIGSYATSPISMNYNAIMKGGTLDRNWRAGSFRGRTIIAVGKAAGGGAQFDGYMGFNNDKGLRKTTVGTTEEVTVNNIDDWTFGSGILRSNGAVTTVASLKDYSVILGERATSANSREQFFLGGYFAGRTFTSYDFAEVLVYSRALTTPEKEKVESYLALKYGITLTHPYYASDWNGGLGTMYYDTTGGYSQEIAGIGRDDFGRMIQKQGRSSLPTSVVSFARGTHALYDSLNGSTFQADLNYLVAGHTRDNDQCWSNADMRIAGEDRMHYRLPREWKAMRTGTWVGDSVEVGLLVDVTGYNVPPLPPGSTAYYLYTDNNGNFSDGGTNKFPLTLLQPSFWGTKIDPSAFGSTFYFTFGVQLDTLVYARDTVCKAGTFEVHGSRLGDACTALTLDLAGTQFHAAQGGSVTDVTFAVSTNAIGNCLDTLTWQAPTAAPAGLYDVFVDTLPSPAVAGCAIGVFGASFFNNKGALLRTLKVDTGDVAAINWEPGLLDSVYCVNDTNIRPIKLPTASPGFFQYVSGPEVGNPSVLIPNPNNPLMLVHNGTLGTHSVRYVTNSGSSCRDTSDYTFSIIQIKTPNIAYLPTSVFCGGGGFSPPATVTFGPTNGTFTSSPGLVFNDSLTGVIDLPNSTPGVYTIYYVPHNDSCGNVDTTVVTISVPTRAYYDYTDTVYCQGAGTAAPLIQFQPSSGSFALSPGSPSTGLVFNANTGVIDLDSSSAGLYYIEYNGISGSCVYNDSDIVRIKAPVDASFTLVDDTLCLSDPNFRPNQADTSGYFTSLNGLVSITPLDSIVPSASMPGGPYNLVHIVVDTFCSDTFSRPIWFRGIASANITYSDTVVCENDPNPFPIFGNGISGGTFFSTNGAQFVSASTGEVNIGPMAVGTGYNIQYAAPDPDCPDTFLIATLNIDSVPNAGFNITADSICQNSPDFRVNVLPPPGGFSFSLFVGQNQVAGAFGGDTLHVSTLAPGGPFMVQNIQTLGACRDTAFDFITIVEQDTASIAFIPDEICIGGNNPFPLITGDGGGIFALGTNPPDPVFVSSDSGIVYLYDTMALDTYWVVYTTQGLCSDVDSSYVIIQDNVTAQFDFLEGQVCQTDSGTISPVAGFQPGGLFTATPAGLDIVDNSLGVIQINTSQADTFTIKYELSSAGSCESEFSDILIVVERDTSTTFNYVLSPYCPSDNNPMPVMNGSHRIEGLFSAPGVYFANQDSGVIALAATPPDTYLVTFSKRTVCEEEFFDQVIIKPSADASFSYPQVVYCVGPSVPTPLVANYGGVFSYFADSTLDTLTHIIDIDPDSGEIDLITAAAGNYTITYTITPTPSSCGGYGESNIRILPQPTNVGMHSEQGDSICENTFVLFRAAGADLVTWQLNGVDTSTGTIYEGIGLDSGDVVTAVFNTLEGCQDERSITMHVFPIPDAEVILAPEILAGNDAVVIDVLLHSNETYLNWEVSGIGTVTFDSTRGSTAIGDSGTTVPLPNTVFLESEINPAQFTYLITPRTFLCRGKTDTVTVRVNPNNLNIFIPQVITPDGNGLNDRWFIQWKLDIDPSLFTIKLFNSAGALVHTMTPLNQLFEGQADAGYLPDGVYWYILQDDKGAKVEAGGLTIRRK